MIQEEQNTDNTTNFIAENRDEEVNIELYHQSIRENSLSDQKIFVKIPAVQSMQKYLLFHYKQKIIDRILCTVNRYKTPERTDLADNSDRKVLLNREEIQIQDMVFWRYNSTMLLVDVIVILMPEKSISKEKMYCELWVDMKDEIAVSYGETDFLCNRPLREYWMLSCYLIPLMSKDQIEKGAEKLLSNYLPNVKTEELQHDAFLLAKSMGLSIGFFPLHNKNSTLSTLYFRSGVAKIERKSEKQQEKKIICNVTIPKNTIVINTNAVHKDSYQLAVYHECIHFEWHRMFFCLQNVHHSDINKLRTKQIRITKEKAPANPLKWMEWQARRGSYCLMMPKNAMDPIIQQYMSNRCIEERHDGIKYDRIIRSIARKYSIPKFRVRARLIQMGFIAAKGSLNYVDGQYIEPFAFNISTCEKNYSFVIDRKGLFDLYRTNDNLRRKVTSNECLYVDGHVCLNDSRYICRLENGMLRLTSWANAHVDQCCLRFVHVYEQCGVAEYRFGVINSDEEYNRHYFEYVNNQRVRTNKDRLFAIRDIIHSLPANFPSTLSFLMGKAGITIEELEEKSYISSRTISRLRSEERETYSLDQVIALCVALQLPPWLSRELLHRAGIVLRQTHQHQAYQFILDCLFMDTIDQIQAFLIDSGCKPLRISNP